MNLSCIQQLLTKLHLSKAQPSLNTHALIYPNKQRNYNALFAHKNLGRDKSWYFQLSHKSTKHLR